MTRILVDLAADDIKWLDRFAEEQGKSRAAVLRQAVAAYKSHAANRGKKYWIERGVGYWKGRAGFALAVEDLPAMRRDRTAGDV